MAIVGDYFDPRYIRELAKVAEAASPDDQVLFFCTPQYEHALRLLFDARGIDNVTYQVLDSGSPVLTQWARDVAVAGLAEDATTLVVSPDKHGETKEEAEATAMLLGSALPEFEVKVAPFVFAGGNIAFLDAGTRRVLIIGRKALFDNAVYQRREWAPGYDEPALLEAMAATFGVDEVIVVGEAQTRPDTRLYFEYHIDLGMTVLRDNRAVVNRLDFDDGAHRELHDAIDSNHPVISRFSWLGPDSIYPVLSSRLETVAREYDSYASVLDSLGVDVFRSPIRWQHVLASMSWTNIVQRGETILMPVYPDSLRGVVTAVESDGGQTKISLDVSGVGEEAFELEGPNLENYRLYESLGYDVVPVPEYLHYMGGGLHCFVNVLE